MSRKYPAKKRIELVAEVSSKQVYDHYQDLCQVVHGRNTFAAAGPLGSLTKTIGFVQYLYEQHQREICKNEAGTSPKSVPNFTHPKLSQ